MIRAARNSLSEQPRPPRFATRQSAKTRVGRLTENVRRHSTENIRRHREFVTSHCEMRRRDGAKRGELGENMPGSPTSFFGITRVSALSDRSARGTGSSSLATSTRRANPDIMRIYLVHASDPGVVRRNPRVAAVDFSVIAQWCQRSAGSLPRRLRGHELDRSDRARAKAPCRCPAARRVALNRARLHRRG